MQTDRRRIAVRQLWMERPSNNRLAADLMTFYVWLSKNRPELLMRGKTFGEAHQLVVQDLRGLVGGPAPEQSTATRPPRRLVVP
jgi:hypothetical protein